MKTVFKTKSGVELFQDNDGFYSKNPDEIFKALKEDVCGSDVVASHLAVDLTVLTHFKGIKKL